MSDAPQLAGYHHLGITVCDIDVSEAWYTKTLGLVRAFVENHDNDTGYARVLTRPGTAFFLGLDHHEEADRKQFDPRRTGLDHVALAVESADEVRAWVTHLDALEVAHEPLLETDDPVPLAMVLLRDPNGIVIELIWTGV